MEKIINKTKISLIKGDIAAQETDAIVNAANNHFWMGSGVAGAILKAGGKIVEEQAMAEGPKQVGEAVITSGGNLKAKYVIHAASMGEGKVNIADATKNTFKIAKENNIKSISFPALGTGVAGHPLDECAMIMLKISVEEANKSENLKEIRFVLFDNKSLKVFEEVFSKMPL